MSDVFDVSPNNSYLTTKQWEEVVDYVRNRKNEIEIEETVIEEAVEEDIIEEPK